jgi:hypothetical protein
MTVTRPSSGSKPDRATSAALITELEQALVSERLNVLMASDDAVMLDTCAKGLVDRLRNHHGAHVSLLFEINRELILERFNALVDALPVEQARAAAPADAPFQVWLLQVRSTESEEQARLLMRLTQDFPGAGLCLILIASNRSVESLVNAPGGRQLVVSQWSNQEAASERAGPDPTRQKTTPARRDSRTPATQGARTAARRATPAGAAAEAGRRKTSGITGGRLALIIFGALLVAIAIGFGLHYGSG